MKNLLKISLRQNAVFVPLSAQHDNVTTNLTETMALLVANLSKLGFGVSEPLLRALNNTTPAMHAQLLTTFREVMGINKNWTPLVKAWDTPTGESVVDHIITFFTNVFQSKGSRLACGHIIPSNTFPLERYNGCPFCGTPFQFGELEHTGQGSKKKLLELWTEKEMQGFFEDLLTSKTALDATQMDSLKILLAEYPLPDVQIGMKETLMAVIDAYVQYDEADKAQPLFTSPTDIMRYLWYKHTGFLQLVEPKTIIKRHAKNHQHIVSSLNNSAKAKLEKVADLKLKYSRKECLMVANWLNKLNLSAEQACEMMHPKRNMWVRFIRALRLAEYSKRDGFTKLATLLDVFYNQQYEVWQGRVNHYRLRCDAETTLGLLKERPGLFARSLFANMLWFGSDQTVKAFAEVVDKVPARLVFTLNMYAESYFNPTIARSIKPLGGVNKHIPANKLLSLYSQEQLKEMKGQVEDLSLLAIKKRFASIANHNKTIYIDPALFNMPVAIGDRSESIQDLPVALMGTRFAIEGDTVRLFMQWGTSLPAQHMDMDLSCHIAYQNKVEICSFSQLVATGCKHSGDIRSIPYQVGTAEYIELNVADLQKANAQYVTFTCNAYSNGSITPNLVVGWMNSRFPMKISGTTGVAYDPSCVQHQVRIVQGLSKGLVFGVLDVKKREIVWLELPFYGQVVQQLNLAGVTAMLAKLNSKLSVGNLLKLKAEAQSLALVDTCKADEVYTMQWAVNAAAVTKLLVD